MCAVGEDVCGYANESRTALYISVLESNCANVTLEDGVVDYAGYREDVEASSSAIREDGGCDTRAVGAFEL